MRQLASLGILLTAVVVVMLLVAAKTASSSFTGEGIIYDVKFGRVQCALGTRSACGVTLTKCHDARDYLCLTDVRRDAK